MALDYIDKYIYIYFFQAGTTYFNQAVFSGVLMKISVDWPKSVYYNIRVEYSFCSFQSYTVYGWNLLKCSPVCLFFWQEYILYSSRFSRGV